ncbi:MAG: ABC transporter permease [Spirochaetes bacterium]|nr:MAG: ABC transporter permease [Spirochaetota bacterium]
MKFLIHFAWKNLSRYRKRTVITSLALAFGIGLYIFTDSMLVGIAEESERNLIWYETSSARIMDKEYWQEKDNLPLKYAIDNKEQVLDTLKAAGIKAAPRTVFAGEVIVYKDPYPEDGSIYSKIFAIDPLKDSDVFRFKDAIVKGRYLKPGENGVLIGSWLAEDIGADVGFPLSITTRTRDGYMQVIDTTIVGIINCPNPYINRASLFIPLDTADSYLDMRGGVTEIDMKYSNFRKAASISSEVLEKLGPLAERVEIKTWEELAADFIALAEMKSKSSGIFLLLIFVIAIVGVSNTMLMAVFERERELGMMRAMGMEDKQVRRAFLLEAAGIGIIGSLAGILFGILLDFLIIHWGIDYTSILRKADMGYRVSGVLYGTWNPSAMIKAFFIGIFLAVASAWIPVKRGLKMEITDTLRNV